MEFTNRELNKKITSFLTKAYANGTLDGRQKSDLEILLKERDGTDWVVVREELKQQKERLVARLGIIKKTTEKGAAGSIDNLLVLINSFAVLFVIAALIPVFYIYWDTTWVIPVALFCPAVHFFAFRLARNPKIRPSRTKNMHLFAAVVSVVPLAGLAAFAANLVRPSVFTQHLPATVGVLWTIYLILVALLVRTEAGFYWALIVAAFVASLGMLCLGRDLAGASCLHLLLAMFLYCLSGRARGGKSSMRPGRLHRFAGFFLTLAFVGLIVFLSGGIPPATGRFMVAVVLYMAALAFLPTAMRSEGCRLSDTRVRNGWKWMLAATCLFFGTALLARGSIGFEGLPMIHGMTPRLPLYVFLSVVLAWSLLLLYEQFLAINDFDENVFTLAVFLLLICLTVGYVAVAFNAAHLLALLLAAGVFAATMRLHRSYAAVLPDSMSPGGKASTA